MTPTTDTTMDEPRPTTTEFHCRLRTAFHNLGEEYGVTGFEAAGVLSYLAAEVNADNLAADGLLARGPGLKRRWRNEPEPATATAEKPASILEELIAGADRHTEVVAGPVTQEDYIAGLKFQITALERLNKMWIDAFNDEWEAHQKLKQSVGQLPVEQEREEPTSAAAYIAGLEATVAELQSDYRTLDRGHERMTKKATELSERVASLAAENDRLTAERESAEVKCRDLEQERGARIDEADELYSKLEKAEARVKELEASLAKSQAMYTRLSHDYALMGKELSGKVEKLEATVKKLRVDNRTLNYSYEQMAKKANELGARTAILAGLAKKAEELKEQVKDLQVMRDSLISSGISKSELCEQQAKRIAELESALAETQFNYRVLDRDLTLTSQRRVELGERVAFLAKENGRLADELEKAEAKVKELEAKHESMINALRGGIGLRERLTERIAYLTAEQQAARKPRIWGIF